MGFILDCAIATIPPPRAFFLPRATFHHPGSEPHGCCQGAARIDAGSIPKAEKQHDAARPEPHDRWHSHPAPLPDERSATHSPTRSDKYDRRKVKPSVCPELSTTVKYEEFKGCKADLQLPHYTVDLVLLLSRLCELVAALGAPAEQPEQTSRSTNTYKEQQDSCPSQTDAPSVTELQNRARPACPAQEKSLS